MILTIAAILSSYYLQRIYKKKIWFDLYWTKNSFFRTRYGMTKFNRAVFYAPYIPLQMYKVKGNQP